jgi:formylglycine-generating enzyme required for sulfatase activity
MVKLPGGTFPMGAQSEDPNGPNHDPEAGDDEGPVHMVTLGPFLIGKHEVTQAQWKVVMGTTPSDFTGDETRPVESVSWEDIQEFEARTGLALPTEAQWEYACRAGTAAPFAGKLEDLGWFGENSVGTTHPAGTKAPNGFGLHDLHGNVWEWCEDVYDEGFYGRPEAAGPDPVSRASSGLRVVRGGSWYDVARHCRSSYRFGYLPEGRGDDLGFRPARPAP